MKRFLGWLSVCVVLAGAGLAACAPYATSPQTRPAVEATAEAPTTAPAAATQAPTAPLSPSPTMLETPMEGPTAVPRTLAPASPTPELTPSATVISETRVVELEWPPQMRLGDSDTVRLALLPAGPEYVLKVDFPEHQTVTQTVAVARPGGYALAAVARLDGVGFNIAPPGEQVRGVPLDEAVVWRWTLTPRAAGTQRLVVALFLRWTSTADPALPPLETDIYSKALTVRVTSFLGLTARQTVVSALGGLVLGSVLTLPLAAYAVRPRRKLVQVLRPEPGVIIEKPPGVELSPGASNLLRALFRQYARLTLESEFRSGYSGARTFLALPVRPDGRADAYTIAKLGERAAIQREFENYETFVKDTLPPITARIQSTPVTLPGEAGQAALRYTFIGEAGRSPVSLRQALLANPDPALLEKLFATFGPHWWMQRRPYTFRLAQEYDQVLAAHYVLEPVEGGAAADFDGRLAPAQVNWQAGDLVRLRHFRVAERRADGCSLSLVGTAQPGQPPLRLRWLSLNSPHSAVARVTATRETLLREWVAGFDRYGLPDPLARLNEWLNERVIGTRATIHGDLNLENILVGPGGFMWLIDFAQTRDGHPLYDFAHLEAQLIAHVIVPQLASPAGFLALERSVAPGQVLRLTLQKVAAQCLFNPAQPREYHLALALACLGALKFSNLTPLAKHCLYLTAAQLAQTL